jgi:N-acyl-D-aspartate/D-glutamate deacylase
VPLQISHLTAVARLTDRSRWAVERSLELIEDAQSRDIDVSFDMHTRHFGTTNLSAVLPPWALEGGKSAIAEQLKSPSCRKEMRAYPNIVSALARGDWKKIVVFKSKAQPEVSQRSIGDISEERGTDTYDTIYDLLLAEMDNLHELMILAFNYKQEDLDIAFEHPGCMVGSDATALATDGPLQKQSFHGAYSWAAWFYRYFVRRKKTLSMHEAVRRLTSLPARRIGLKDRGVIREGAWADLAIFDPELFGEKATIFEPNQLATGMRHVLVNGIVTLRNGLPTGDRGGQVLRAV